MLTDKDIKRLLEVFATKDYITDYIDSKIDNLEHRINDNHDKLYKELLDSRMERDAHRQEHNDIGKRFEAIESVPVVAHELKMKKYPSS